MKSRTIVLALCVATVLGLVFALVLHRSVPAARSVATNEHTFEVTGKIISLDSRTVRIAHEAIAEYMPAMTMPFTVAQPYLLTGLVPGDQVHFQLVVTAHDSWIARIRKVQDAASPASSDTFKPGEPEPTRELERVQMGEKMPNFTLVDQDGHELRLSDFVGSPVVLTFIYTRCPLPNFCPLMSRNFAELQERLAKKPGHRVHLISISIDPEFDRPEILKSYASRYEARPTIWSFATGTREQIDGLATSLGLTHDPENGFIAHDLRTALIGPDGKLVQVWKSNVWTPYEIERALAALIPGSHRNLSS